MTPADQTHPPLPGANPAGADRGASLANLAIDTSDYVRAWSALFASEARLAGVSVLRLGLGMLIVPALVLMICVSADALLVTLLQRWFHDWASATAAVVLFNVVCLVGLLAAMRRWWRNLSLPRSRSALGHLLERLA
jgi:hypothetical protein